MRLFAFAVLLCLAVTPLTSAQGKEAPLKKINEISIPEGKYHLELPSGWNPKNPVAVIVFLHGKTVDLKADNAKGQLSNDFVGEMKRRGYAAVCPVMPPEHRPHWWENGGSEDYMEAVLADVKKKLNVSHIVCAGFSAGANYTLWFGQHRKHHHHFSGLLVMAGGGQVDARAPEEIKRKPIWLGCGDKDMDDYDDKMKTTGGAQKTFKELKDGGYDAVYEEFPGVGHVMDGKMVKKAVEWFDAHAATIRCIGALARATAEKTGVTGGTLAALEAAVKETPAEPWKGKADKELTRLRDQGAKAIADAAALADPAKTKEELKRLAEQYAGCSLEKSVKDALAGAGAKK